MKKYFSLIIILIIFCINSIAQNFVPNPSFEDTVACPFAPTQIDFAFGWSSYGISPDYFNACAPSCAWPSTCLGIPQNRVGYQLSYDGNAYSGVATYAYGGGNIREYMGVELIQPLTIGKKYFVSAYVCRADGYDVHGATNNFGFRFSTIAYTAFSNSVPTDNFSHVHDSILITDSINWTKISGSFIADSVYQYLAIGNFYDDLHTDTLDIIPTLGQPTNNAYYLVDYVCVTEDSLDNCDVIIGINSKINKEELKLFPNPFSDQLSIKSETNEQKEIILYDIFSRKILEVKFISSITVNTMKLENGIYFYEVMNKGGMVGKGKVIKE